MYIRRLSETFVEKAILIFEIYSFEIDTYMYVLFFCPVAYSA